jgi:uncharacterized protein (TIGR03086 family)
MDQGLPNIVPMTEAAIGVAQGIVANVRSDQWATPSACAGWTVRDVVGHLVVGNETAATAFAGACAVPQGDPLGDAPKAALADSSARYLAALRRPGALTQSVEMPFGTMPGQTIGMFRFVDFLVHGWDIAKVTGQPTDFAPELCDAALTISHQGMAEYDRASSNQFGPEQPAPESASSADRLAAFLGRTI